MKTRKYLLFNESEKNGSVEHFHHFMWGYLLPSLYCIFISNKYHEKNKYFFRDCGPVMNQVLQEFLADFSIHFEIVKGNVIPNDVENVDVERWDNCFKNYKYPKGLTGIEWVDKFVNAEFKKKVVLRNKIYRLRAFICSHFGFTHVPQHFFLLLKRSKQPGFYDPIKGQAEVKSYGTQRRELIRIEETNQEINKGGVPSKVYEPGIKSLKDQIKQFSVVKGIIGIRGAEFSNIIWLPKNSTVVLVQLASMNNSRSQQAICDILGHKYLEIFSEESKQVKLDSGQVLLKLRS